MDNVTKALALARLGIKVFPARRSDKSPLTNNGFYDATSDDWEQIATWFSLDHQDENTVVAYWAGGSDLLILDIDRKDGKDGFASIAEAGHDLGDTHSYPTQSDGEHRVFDTTSLDEEVAAGLTLAKKHLGLEGVDIRAGGSYAVWWADEVPTGRAGFSQDIPEWMLTKTSTEGREDGDLIGFSGSVEEWLDVVSQEVLPSGRVRDFMAGIPTDEFGHPEMVALAWEIVRLGSERETGVRTALDALSAQWLRPPYDKAKYRRDLNVALAGAIKKAGRLQYPLPSISPVTAALSKADAAGIRPDFNNLERSVSETATELDMARVRKEMFSLAAKNGLSAATALSLVAGSKSFKRSMVSLESTWFGEGEAAFHDAIAALGEEEAPEADPDEEIKDADAERLASFAKEAERFTLLTPDEQADIDAGKYRWWGDEYLEWVKSRLDHFNAPYHRTALWSILSLIMSPWGKMPARGAKMIDLNLYSTVLGMSSSGKSEAWEFAMAVIDAYFGTDESPIIGDTKKVTALSLHRALILRDGAQSLVYSDEVQSFFEDLKSAKWQGSILGDLSDYYGGNVPPKNTLNDKEISGKRAKSLLTVYFTGIQNMSLNSISIGNWQSGLFYRFLWSFGYDREEGSYEENMEEIAGSYTAKPDDWARDFHRLQVFQETKWGEGRMVKWEEDARKRLTDFKRTIDETTKASPLYDEVFVAANGRFKTSVMKCATLAALADNSEKVQLKHVIIALSYAGAWHRSMVLAVEETGRESFDRDVEKCFIWIKRNMVTQVGKAPYVQRSAVMRAFRPNEVAERMLRQLTEEGRLARSGDIYEVIDLDWI